MIRTRLAPSPTGFVHIGTLRTALYCYLLAKKNQGIFFIRIEDTDKKRFVEGAINNLLKTLEWTGLIPDEGVRHNRDGEVEEIGKYGPYVQSKRLPLYHKYVQELLKKGVAYHCFCSPERLSNMRAEQIKNKRPPMYDRRCLQLSPEEVEKAIEAGENYVIRQKIPHDKIIELNDIVRGKVKFDCSKIDDQVLLKSDGFPTYHLAHIVDDHLMKTNPIIRGEEWLPSTPKHLLLFEALGWDIPEFAHLPLLLNKDKGKLSKRQGDVAVEDYINKGYLPEALINFVAFLGWNPGTEQEIFSMEELIEVFSLERVHKAGAIFDIEKLNWFNGQYIRQKTVSEFVDLIKPYLKEASLPILEYPEELLNRAAALIQERVRYLSEAPELIKFFFIDPDCDVELMINQKMKITSEIVRKALEASRDLLNNEEDFSEEHIKDILLDLVTEIGLKNGQVLWPIRAVLSGEQYSPGAFEMVSVLGKEVVVRRIDKALSKLKV